MLIQYFQENIYDKLEGSISSNLSWYCSPTAQPEDIGIDSDCISSSSLDLPKFALVIPSAAATDDEKNKNDLINIKNVYGTWKDLSPLLAQNKYLWSYYCHCDLDYRKYINARWDGENFSESAISDHFFISSRRKLVRENALSSLWWKGHLTYDAENNNNPFWLTETLGTTTNMADFIDTFNSYSPIRAKGVLKAIAGFLEEQKIDRLKNHIFRGLNRFLNRYSAVTPLDYLSEDEIKELVKAELYRLLETENK